MKNSWKYIFLGGEAHLLPRLYVKVLYIIFRHFEKYQDSPQTPKVLVFDFTEK
jgi:hypothetical protein